MVQVVKKVKGRKARAELKGCLGHVISSLLKQQSRSPYHGMGTDTLGWACKLRGDF